MKLVVEIPDKDIPKQQDIMDIHIHFIDGEVCECDYPFQKFEKMLEDIKGGRMIDEPMFESKQQKRQVVETIDGIFYPMFPYYKPEFVERIRIGLRILRSIRTKEDEVKE